MGWGYGSWGMGWWGGMLMVLFWVAVVVGIVLLARNLSRERGEKKDDPLEILNQRYARGEIGTSEYEERKKNLGG